MSEQDSLLAFIDKIIENGKDHPEFLEKIMTSIIELCINKKYSEIIQKILNTKIINPCFHKNAILYFAIENNFIEIIQTLLKDGTVDPGYDTNYAIRIATKHGYIEMVQLF